MHHIFPKSQFPQIAHYVENLILLTATQHNTKAHPNNKTQQVNKDYQLVCLLAKADSIENSLLRYGEKYYRKESFVYVINVGLLADFSIGLSFNDIKTKLVKLVVISGVFMKFTPDMKEKCTFVKNLLLKFGICDKII